MDFKKCEHDKKLIQKVISDTHDNYDKIYLSDTCDFFNLDSTKTKNINFTDVIYPYIYISQPPGPRRVKWSGTWNNYYC